MGSTRIRVFLLNVHVSHVLYCSNILARNSSIAQR